MAQFPLQLMHQVMEPFVLANMTWPAQVELPLAMVLQQWMTTRDVGGLDTLVVLLTHNRLCRADAATTDQILQLRQKRKSIKKLSPITIWAKWNSIADWKLLYLERDRDTKSRYPSIITLR